jgi:hypothetical protein
MKQWIISITATTKDDVELTEKDFADALHRVPTFEVVDVHIEEVSTNDDPNTRGEEHAP